VSADSPHFSFYLVQRLKKQEWPSGQGFDAIFALDYMGSSEFEWGAIPKALRSLRATVLARDTAEVTHRGVTRTIHVVGPAQGMNDRLASLNAWLADDRPRGKERSAFPENLLGQENQWDRDVIAWWAIDSDLCWALTSDVADDLWRAITGTSANADVTPSGGTA